MNRTYLKLSADEFYSKLYNQLIEDPENKEYIEENGIEYSVTKRFGQDNTRCEMIETLLQSATDTYQSLSKDLKISFDTENMIVENDRYGMSILGLQHIKDFNFLGVYAGGDWEVPVFFILYYDDKNKLRAYIPSDGNPYNRKTKEAWGNDCDEDFNIDDPMYDFVWDKIKEDIKKRFGL